MKRNPKLRDKLKLVGDKYVAEVDMYFEIPVMFENHDLIVNGDTTSLIGSFAMVVPSLKQYAVFNMAVLLTITYDELSVAEKDGMRYYRYSFKKGQTVFPNKSAVKRGGVLYSIMNLYLFHSNQPWFLTIADLFALLNGSSYYAGINTDSKPEIIELFIALAARDGTNLDTLFKNRKKPDSPLKWVSLADVTFLKSTFAMITNNNQAKGMSGALVATPNEPSAIEKVVRA